MKKLIHLLLLIILYSGCKSTFAESISEENILGDYVSKSKDFKYRILITKQDFKYWKYYGIWADFTRGTWKIIGDNLILQSSELEKDENIIMSLSTANWITFDNKVLRINKKTIFETDQKIKFFKTKM
jgi:hypothetical protein